MTSETPSQAIGSDAWVGASDHEADSIFHIRATAFYNSINWPALAAIASGHKDNIGCKFAESFSMGHFNMTRRLLFDNGTSWIARLRFPMDEGATDREALPFAQVMQIEVASMKFFKSKTSIPVPQVHAYCFSDSNVGAPYILMDYIHGTPADKFQWQDGSKLGLFGTPAQDLHLHNQLAEIHAIVSSFRFPSIGGLYYNEENDDFFIGPELQTGKGPWTSSAEYYDDVAAHLLESIVSRDELSERESFMVPLILASLLRKHAQEQHGPFRLANRDFGAHNVLVDADYNIVGMIDFDGILAAPIEVVAQVPMHCGLQIEPPGVVDTRPAVVERVARTLPKVRTYKETLAKCEQERNLDNPDSNSEPAQIAGLIGSMTASMYQGFENYQFHMTSSNDEWMKSCLEMATQLAKQV